MREYSYRGSAQAIFGLAQVGGTLIVVGTVLLFLAIVIIGIATHSGIGAIACWAGWMLLIGLMVGLGLMNAFPTVWISEEQLTISAFLSTRIAIPWEDVVDVKSGVVPFGGVLVRARRISSFHRLYGWLYSKSILPSFVIGPEISDYKELVEEIQQRASQPKMDPKV